MTHGIDTDFLVAVEIREHPFHDPADALLQSLLADGHDLALAPQTLAEFIHVATDPRRMPQPLVMADAIRRAGDRQLETRVDAFQATARDMFRTVEEDPRDLSQARKYLGVYLTGARDATVKFADLYARDRDPAVRADYVTLLDDLETNFAARTKRMLVTDRSDLDVEIDVLRDRLNRDNLHIET